MPAAGTLRPAGRSMTGATGCSKPGGGVGALAMAGTGARGCSRSGGGVGALAMAGTGSSAGAGSTTAVPVSEISMSLSARRARRVP